ncbi:MAG: arsenate reductase/protein-tyrosine-phosphatase family protein [Anaerolineaceae bacterium]
MPAILFICTANQFRSPIAAASFAQVLSSSRNPDTWKIASAGTWTTSGLPAHPKAVIAASTIGLDITNHQTQEVNSEFINEFDLIVVMENNHKESLELEFPQTLGKIVILGQIANVPDGEIPDPAKDAFTNSDEVAELINTSIKQTFSKLVQLTLLLHDGFSPII